MSIDPELIDWVPPGNKHEGVMPSLAVLAALTLMILAAPFALWAGYRTGGWGAILLLYLGIPITFLHCLVCGGALVYRRTSVSAVLTIVATTLLLFCLMMFRSHGDGADHWHTFQAIFCGSEAYTDMTTPAWWNTHGGWITVSIWIAVIGCWIGCWVLPLRRKP